MQSSSTSDQSEKPQSTTMTQENKPEPKDLAEALSQHPETRPKNPFPWRANLNGTPDLRTVDPDINKKMKYWQRKTSRLMFRNGDYSTTNMECDYFVLDFLFANLNLLMRRLWKHARAANRTVIELKDLLRECKNNFRIVGRFITFILLEGFEMPLSDEQIQVDEDPGKELLEFLKNSSDDDLRSAGAKAEEFKEMAPGWYSQLVNWDCKTLCMAGGISASIEMLHEHGHRYLRLDRRRHFLSPSKKHDLEVAELETYTTIPSDEREIGETTTFEELLGEPPLAKDVIYAIDFVAMEILANIVDVASQIRDARFWEKIEFLYGMSNIDILSDDPSYQVYGRSSEVIQLSHYKEAVPFASLDKKQQHLFAPKGGMTLDQFLAMMFNLRLVVRNSPEKENRKRMASLRLTDADRKRDRPANLGNLFSTAVLPCIPKEFSGSLI